MKKLLTICLVLLTGILNAQDLFQESLYSADLVMTHQEKIGLTDQQSTNIKKIHSQNAGEFSFLKWDLDAATKKLKTMLAENRPDQDAVQKQMDKILALENSLKKKQLSTLVAIKNELSSGQQDELDNLKSSRHRVNGVAAISPVKGASSISISSTREDGQPDFFIRSHKGLVKVKDIKDIDPKNIQSIEVLKGDAAKEKMSGERFDSKRGVIIISLKDGVHPF